MSFVIEEEERLSTLLIDSRDVNRTSHSKTELIPMHVWTVQPVQIIKVVVGVERAVAQKLIHNSMQTTPPGSGYKIDNVAGTPAVLRCERVLLDLELLHILRR